MSETTETHPRPKSSFQHFMERHGIVWMIWLTIIISQWATSSQKFLRGELVGNDDFMRMTQIRDWLGGQGWYDLHQYRLNPENPLISHWSRLPDVLMGVPIALLTPIFGSKAAEIIVFVTYPSLLFLLLMYVLVAIARRISTTPSIALAVGFMTALSLPTFIQYRMGRIDHHGLQIIMAIACCLFIIKSAEKSKHAIVAGILAGLGLYVGIESAPYVAAACIAMTLIWVFDETDSARRLRYFGLSLAVTTLICLVLSAPISRWTVPSCDALSIVYTQLTIFVSMVLVGLSIVGKKITTPAPRFATAAVLGLSALALTVWMYPNCLKGPYAEVDQRLVDLWLVNVAEAKKFHELMKGDIVAGTASISLPILCLIGAFVYHKRTNKGLSLIPRTLVIFTVVTFAAGLIQMRLMSFVGCMAIPLAAYLLATSMDWADQFTSMTKRLAIRIGFIILMAPITVPLIFAIFTESDAAQTPAEQNKLTCLSEPTLTTLNTLPQGHAITQIDLGAPILYYTSHSVSSAPYHRNTEGNVMSFDMFIEDEATAKSVVARTGADYVIACGDIGETTVLIRKFPDGMLAKLKAGDTPEWLEKLELEGSSDLLVYKVVKANND